MGKTLLVLIFVLLALSFGTSHAAINLNMAYAPLQGGICSDLTPSQIQTAYGFTSLYSQGTTGKGESIAIVVADGDPNLLSDVNAFDSEYGLPALTNGSNLFLVYPFGQPNDQSKNWTSETALDVEVAHSLATGANIYLVIAPNESWLFNAINYTVYNLPVGTISLSWGSSEAPYSSAQINQLDGVFAAASQRRISVFAASGDTGAYNGLNTPNVNFPASSPYVIGVGGTVLSVGSNGDYQGETAWNGSGGGESKFFPRPAAQPDLSSNRMIPDVSFNAGTQICAYVDSRWGAYYGTSIAAPAWAALDALVNQESGGIGALSLDSLYSAYYDEGSLTFNFIDGGSNDVYSANGSYNMVTGIGTPKAYELVQVLSKTAYQIYFTSDSQGTVFNINGINYTSSTAVNFSFGETVSLRVYSAVNSSSTTRYVFASFSGEVNSTSDPTSFSVTSSGTVTADFNTQYKVNEFDVGGYTNTSEFLNEGSTLQVSSLLNLTYENKSYSLSGYSVDNGPTIYRASGSLAVDAPLNLTFVWNKGTFTTFSLAGAPAGANLLVSYLYYVPLSNTTSTYLSEVKNGGDILSIPDTVINYSGSPYYVGNSRYISYNASQLVARSITVQFVEQSKYYINLLSSDQRAVSATEISIRTTGANSAFYNNTVWAQSDSDFSIQKIVLAGNGFNVLKSPVYLSPSNSSQNITLPVSNISISLDLYLGIPIISAGVTFAYDNLSLKNSTGIAGVVTFVDVPDSGYNISVSAYGSDYEYQGLSGSTQTLNITPFIYQIYLIIGVISVILVLFGAYEELKHRRKTRSRRRATPF